MTEVFQSDQSFDTSVDVAR